MKLDQEFNASDMPEEQSFEPLPSGWYTATIAGAEVKDTKAGTGQYIAVRYDITGPSHQGRVVFGNLNIKNPNETAEEIGRRQLGDIMRAGNLASVADTDQLVGVSLMVKLKVRRSEEYGDSNDVAAIKGMDGTAAVVAATVNATKTNGGSSAPWAK